jgi:hypothetical protein
MSEGLANKWLPGKAGPAKVLGSSERAVWRHAKPRLIPIVRRGIQTLVCLDHFKPIFPGFGGARRPTRSMA